MGSDSGVPRSEHGSGDECGAWSKAGGHLARGTVGGGRLQKWGFPGAHLPPFVADRAPESLSMSSCCTPWGLWVSSFCPARPVTSTDPELQASPFPLWATPGAPDCSEVAPQARGSWSAGCQVQAGCTQGKCPTFCTSSGPFNQDTIQELTVVRAHSWPWSRHVAREALLSLYCLQHVSSHR